MTNRFLTKIATLIQLYQHDETGRKTWHIEGKEKPGHGWSKVRGKVKYVKAKK